MKSQDSQKADLQGRSERSGESYSVLHVEPLSAAKTTLAAFSASCQGISSRSVDVIGDKGAVCLGGPGRISPAPL